MNKINILKEWNFWEKVPQTGIPRKKYLKKLSRLLKMPEIIAISGVRRAGKSTILLQLIKQIHQKNHISYKNTLYINFEDPRLGEELSAKDLFTLIKEFKKEFKPKGRIYLFLDEIQNIQGWEKFVRTLYDQKKNIKIIITGSTSKTFNSDLIDKLSGRIFLLKISPLSFSEFLHFKKAKKATKKLFDQYLRFGGFPRVVLEKEEVNKRELLISYYNTIIEKDVILKNNIKGKKELKQLARFVFSNIGTQISTYSLEKTLGISNVNISRYLNYLEEAFLISRISKFSYSVKKQIYNPDKIFSVDTGLANIAGFKFSQNKGRLLENIVNSRLAEQEGEVYYWKNKTEIDFLVFKNREIKKLINVCLTIDDPKTFKRETSSLKKGLKEFPKAEIKLIFLYNQSGRKEKFLKSVLK